MSSIENAIGAADDVIPSQLETATLKRIRATGRVKPSALGVVTALIIHRAEKRKITLTGLALGLLLREVANHWPQDFVTRRAS